MVKHQVEYAMSDLNSKCIHSSEVDRNPICSISVNVIFAGNVSLFLIERYRTSQ